MYGLVQVRMVMYGLVCVCMVMNGLVWACIVIFGLVWVFMAVQGLVWVCGIQYGFGRSDDLLYALLWICIYLYSHLWTLQFFTIMYGSILSCVVLYDHAWLCLAPCGVLSSMVMFALVFSSIFCLDLISPLWVDSSHLTQLCLGILQNHDKDKSTSLMHIANSNYSYGVPICI